MAFDRECFYRDWADAALRGDGRRLRIIVECSSLAGTTSAVLAGLGVSLIPESKVTGGMQEVATLPRPVNIATVVRTAEGVPSSGPVAALARLCGAIRR